MNHGGVIASLRRLKIACLVNGGLIYLFFFGTNFLSINDRGIFSRTELRLLYATFMEERG